MNTHSSERGIALLISLLIMTVLLGVSASLLNITVKQLQFSSIGLASETSFQAANAGMECMLYHDYQGYPAQPAKFDVGQASPPISCMGSPNTSVLTETNTPIRSERRYQFTWGNPSVCSDVTIYKFFDPSSPQDMFAALRRPGTCAAGVTCTVIQSRGYNVACPSPGNNFPPRTIERELTQRY